MFGLYATTGRTVSFLAPTAFALFVTIGGAPYFGILGIVLVLALGLALLIPVKAAWLREGRSRDGAVVINVRALRRSAPIQAGKLGTLA